MAANRAVEEQIIAWASTAWSSRKVREAMKGVGRAFGTPGSVLQKAVRTEISLTTGAGIAREILLEALAPVDWESIAQEIING